MRILMLSWEFPPFVVGGMGKHVAELIPALADLADEDAPLRIHVVTTRSAGGEKEERLNERVTVHRVDVPPIDPNDLFNSVMDGNRALAAHARRLAEGQPFDLIHAHDWMVAQAGIQLKHLWRVPLLSTIHATERGRHQSYLPNQVSHQINQTEWQLCYESWRVIVCSGFMAGELRGYFDIPLDKISIIPNGIDLAPLLRCPEEEVTALRQRYAPKDERLLFFVGRITPEKGLQVLLRAMPFVLQKQPKTKLLVAGKNSEQMHPLVDELRISKQVEILGFISDETRNCLYRAVDVAIFPSLYEPFGIVALEAMAASCNVIVSDVGGLPEVVHHQHSGLTVMANNPQSIAWGVHYLFTHPTQAAQWRQAALEQVQTRYTWDKIASRTRSMYQAIIGERALVDW
jgi:glycosyltransferase involved in cell wall biosynthesis